MAKYKDYDKFVECMTMLKDNEVIYDYNIERIGATDDLNVQVFRNEDDKKPFLSVVFNSVNGDFDHEN